MDHLLNVRLVMECKNKSFEIIVNTIYLVLMSFYDEMFPEKGNFEDQTWRKKKKEIIQNLKVLIGLSMFPLEETRTSFLPLKIEPFSLRAVLAGSSHSLPACAVGIRQTNPSRWEGLRDWKNVPMHNISQSWTEGRIGRFQCSHRF